MRHNQAKILILIILSLFLCVSAFAQLKIAMIDSNSFYDEKSGIKILTNVVIATYDDDFDTPRLRKRISDLKVEIEKLKNLAKPIGNQELEISKLESELQKRQEIHEKRRSILLEPIKKRITEKLEIFRKNKGYWLIIDFEAIEKGIITDNPSAEDITAEFIKFCNEEFEKEKYRNNEQKINFSSR